MNKLMLIVAGLFFISGLGYGGFKIMSMAARFISEAEGFSAIPYLDVGGFWTIGYGHKIKSGETFTRITQSEGYALLDEDISGAKRAVDTHVVAPITDGQRVALVSFVFNVGVGAFEKSTLLRKINTGDFVGAASEFKRWKFAGGKVSEGLLARREKEADMFRGYV